MRLSRDVPHDPIDKLKATLARRLPKGYFLSMNAHTKYIT